MKILTTLKRENNVTYALIPKEIAENLNLNGDKKILANFQKYNPLFMKICKNAVSENKQVEVIYKSNKHPAVCGKISEYTQEHLILFCKDESKSNLIPYSLVLELNVLGENKENKGDKEK